MQSSPFLRSILRSGGKYYVVYKFIYQKSFLQNVTTSLLLIDLFKLNLYTAEFAWMKNFAHFFSTFCRDEVSVYVIFLPLLPVKNTLSSWEDKLACRMKILPRHCLLKKNLSRKQKLIHMEVALQFLGQAFVWLVCINNSEEDSVGGKKINKKKFYIPNKLDGFYLFLLFFAIFPGGNSDSECCKSGQYNDPSRFVTSSGCSHWGPHHIYSCFCRSRCEWSSSIRQQKCCTPLCRTFHHCWSLGSGKKLVLSSLVEIKNKNKQILFV